MSRAVTRLGILMLAKQYKLVVVAAYFGHFIAYCRQLSELWEQYNDLNTKINSCIQNETINSMLRFIYFMKITKYELRQQVRWKLITTRTQQESFGIHKSILETKFFYRKFAWSLNSFFHEID
ncbi:uncharacterized protein LOC105432334 [Pogonomyrmex barbatus]|uniref:Uncharacterized protein LOC105432334 n=1 Tax=Pogonomyrmex barbatus TaxID=144034 RepID=A0A6I9WQB7_9HYME|nr:uncharacterized protein LOC105432334 [Pogonomyrmex barbatus]